MAITYGFYNAILQSDGTYDRVYNSDQIGNMFEGLVTSGVYESVGDALIVRANEGLTIQVGTGRVTTDEGKWLRNDAILDITLQAAHLVLNRWSAIVVRFDYANRTAEIIEKAGVPATDPVIPNLENTQTIKEKCLAFVYVAAGATTITQSSITDTRSNSTLCGWVTGVVKQVDTSELFLQWQTAYEEFYVQMESWKTTQTHLFDAWFSTLTKQLQVNTYVKKYHKVIELQSENGIFPLDMDGYTYDESDILLVNINGIVMTEVYDYLLDTSKTPVEIHTNANLEESNLLEITVLKSIVGVVPMKLAIISQPEDYEGVIGETATFSIGATGVGLTFRWQYSDNGSTWYDSVSTASMISVTISSTNLGRLYRCVVTDSFGDTITSNAAEIREA